MFIFIDFLMLSALKKKRFLLRWVVVNAKIIILQSAKNKQLESSTIDGTPI